MKKVWLGRRWSSPIEGKVLVNEWYETNMSYALIGDITPGPTYTHVGIRRRRWYLRRKIAGLILNR
jgi:hypothetical protein